MCKKWKEVNSISWWDMKRLDCYIKNIGRNIKPLLMHCASSLTELTLTESYCDTSVMMHVKDNCIQLIQLTMNCNLRREDEDSYIEFCSNMCQLKYLKIQECCFTSTSTRELYANILRSLPREIEKIILLMSELTYPEVELPAVSICYIIIR